MRRTGPPLIIYHHSGAADAFDHIPLVLAGNNSYLPPPPPPPTYYLDGSMSVCVCVWILLLLLILYCLDEWVVECVCVPRTCLSVSIQVYMYYRMWMYVYSVYVYLFIFYTMCAYRIRLNLANAIKHGNVVCQEQHKLIVTALSSSFLHSAALCLCLCLCVCACLPLSLSALPCLLPLCAVCRRSVSPCFLLVNVIMHAS